MRRSRGWSAARRGLVKVVAIGIAGLGAAGQSARSAPSEDVAPGAAAPADPEVRIFIERVNDYRESIGCPRLVVDLRAQAVAQRHSEDMHERRYVGHVNPDGDSYADRLRHSGIYFTIAGENVAQTPEGGDGVLQRWLASRPHRENIENCAFLRHGVGRYESMWTHVLFTD